MRSASLLEWSGDIQERENLLGRPALQRMAEIYIQEMEGLVLAIAASLQRADLDAARRAAHHLNANAGSLDFKDLTQTTEILEQMCLKGDLNNALSALQICVPMAQRSVSHLRRHFGIK